MLRGLSNVLSRTAGAFDRAVSGSITKRTPAAKSRSKSESLGHEERMRALEGIRQAYEPFERDDEAFFGSPAVRALRVDARGVHTSRGVRYERADVRWTSRTDTAIPELRDRFHATVENREAAARIFRASRSAPSQRGRAPRSLAILIHGYRAGQYAVEQRVWPVSWLLDKGFDVALYVLPFHAVRAEPGAARFPSSDPRITNEGFRQAIGDLRDLAATARAEGAPHVIALGMSLGGYTASLLATVEPLDFVAPIIPLASFADIAFENERLVGSEEDQRAQHAALDRAHAVVSPFARRPVIEPRRVIVAGAAGDQICPIHHAERLASHFGADLVRFTGGHILQIGRRDAFRAIGARIRELGIAP
jgi:pimeloyl-ACP methyl ester carboxylesterase